MQQAQHITKHEADGTVSRRFLCQCGNSIYKKNLTTGTISFLARGAEIQITPIGDVTQNIIRCDGCKAEHIVVGIVEGSGVVDKISITKEEGATL